MRRNVLVLILLLLGLAGGATWWLTQSSNLPVEAAIQAPLGLGSDNANAEPEPDLVKQDLNITPPADDALATGDLLSNALPQAKAEDQSNQVAKTESLVPQDTPQIEADAKPALEAALDVEPKAIPDATSAAMPEVTAAEVKLEEEATQTTEEASASTPKKLEPMESMLSEAPPAEVKPAEVKPAKPVVTGSMPKLDQSKPHQSKPDDGINVTNNLSEWLKSPAKIESFEMVEEATEELAKLDTNPELELDPNLVPLSEPTPVVQEPEQPVDGLAALSQQLGLAGDLTNDSDDPFGLVKLGLAPADAETDEETPTPEATGSFDIVRITSDGRAVLAGSATPGIQTLLLMNQETLTKLDLSPSGQWSYVTAQALPFGQVQLALAEIGPNDQAQEPFLAVAAVFIDQQEAPTAQPLITEIARADTAGNLQQLNEITGEEAQQNAVAPIIGNVPADKNQTSRSRNVLVVTQTNTEPTFSIISGTLDGPRRQGELFLERVDYDTFGNLVLIGEGEPGTLVNLYHNNRFLDQVRVDAFGSWTSEPENFQSPAGSHMIRVDMMMPQDTSDVVARLQVPFARAQTVWDTEGRVDFEINRGDNLWQIATRAFGSGDKYTLIFERNKGQITNPDLIFPDQMFAILKDDNAG